MPFGLTNAPAVFQRLMQQVISTLNSDSESEFVSVSIDDILVFSKTLQDHLLYLEQVILRIMEVGLKLKPTKCRFVQRELEYLGHIVSRDRLKPSPRLVIALKEFPEPTTAQETRRFLGLCSYYRKFIPHFATIANPSHTSRLCLPVVTGMSACIRRTERKAHFCPGLSLPRLQFRFYP